MTDLITNQSNIIKKDTSYQPNPTSESQYQLDLNQIPKATNNEVTKEPPKKDYCGYCFSFGMICFSLGVICWNLHVLKAYKSDGMVPFLWGSFYSGFGQLFIGILQYIRGDNSMIFFVFGFCGVMNCTMEYCRVNGWFPQPSMVEMGWYNIFLFFSFLSVTLGGWNSLYTGINLSLSSLACLITAISDFCESQTGLKVGAVVGILSGVMGYYCAISTLMLDSYGPKSPLPVF